MSNKCAIFLSHDTSTDYPFDLGGNVDMKSIPERFSRFEGGQGNKKLHRLILGTSPSTATTMPIANGMMNRLTRLTEVCLGRETFQLDDFLGAGDR
jgi:hypothetical protein